MGLDNSKFSDRRINHWKRVVTEVVERVVWVISDSEVIMQAAGVFTAGMGRIRMTAKKAWPWSEPYGSRRGRKE
jgi:hypothetical protein